jgi:hypothetical protein
MPAFTLTTATNGAVLIVILVASTHAIAQALPPLPSATPPTPREAQALVAFRPQVEQLCQALYGRPDAAESCVQRVLDAALPLDLEPTAAPTPGAVIPRAESRGGTVAPDGRE